MSFFGFGKNSLHADQDDEHYEDDQLYSDNISTQSAQSTSKWSNPYVITELVYVDEDEPEDVEFITEEVVVTPLFPAKNWFSFRSRSSSPSDDDDDQFNAEYLYEDKKSVHQNSKQITPSQQLSSTSQQTPQISQQLPPQNKYSNNKYVQYEEIEVDHIEPEFDYYYEEIAQIPPARRLGSFFRGNTEQNEPHDDQEDVEYEYETVPQPSRMRQFFSFNRREDPSSTDEDYVESYYEDQNGTDYDEDIEYEYYYEDQQDQQDHETIFGNIFSLATQGRGFDLESISQMVGIGKPKQRIHAFFHSFQDPEQEADLPRLPGEKPEWVTTPSLEDRKDSDKLFMDPVEVVFGRDALASELQPTSAEFIENQIIQRKPPANNSQEQEQSKQPQANNSQEQEQSKQPQVSFSPTHSQVTSTSSSTTIVVDESTGPQQTQQSQEEQKKEPLQQKLKEEPTKEPQFSKPALPKPPNLLKPKAPRDPSLPQPKTVRYNYFSDLELPGMQPKEQLKPELLELFPFQPSTIINPLAPAPPIHPSLMIGTQTEQLVTLDSLENFQNDHIKHAERLQAYLDEMQRHQQTYYPSTPVEFLATPTFYQHQANINKNVHSHSFQTLRAKILLEDEAIDAELTDFNKYYQKQRDSQPLSHISTETSFDAPFHFKVPKNR